MTLLSVVGDVCAAVGVLQPQSVFSSITGNRTMQEMLSLANEMAQRIAYDTRDWTNLRRTGSHLAGSGPPVDPALMFFSGCEVFQLPENFKRLLLKSNVWGSTSSQSPMVFIPDHDEWLNRRMGNAYNNSSGEWTIVGGQLVVAPALGEGQTISYIYMDKNCINLSSGGRGNEFLNDGDTFLLDERLLKLGMIWQWKAQKGSSYAEDLGTYGDALTNAMGHDSPAPIIVDRLPISAMRGTYFGNIP